MAAHNKSQFVWNGVYKEDQDQWIRQMAWLGQFGDILWANKLSSLGNGIKSTICQPTFIFIVYYRHCHTGVIVYPCPRLHIDLAHLCLSSPPHPPPRWCILTTFSFLSRSVDFSNLALFWLNGKGQIWGFRAFPGERMQGTLHADVSWPPLELIWLWSWSVNLPSFGVTLTRWNGSNLRLPDISQRTQGENHGGYPVNRNVRYGSLNMADAELGKKQIWPLWNHAACSELFHIGINSLDCCEYSWGFR